MNILREVYMSCQPLPRTQVRLRLCTCAGGNARSRRPDRYPELAQTTSLLYRLSVSTSPPSSSSETFVDASGAGRGFIDFNTGGARASGAPKIEKDEPSKSGMANSRQPFPKIRRDVPGGGGVGSSGEVSPVTARSRSTQAYIRSLSTNGCADM